MDSKFFFTGSAGADKFVFEQMIDDLLGIARH